MDPNFDTFKSLVSADILKLETEVSNLKKQLTSQAFSLDNAKNAGSVIIVLESCKDLGEGVVKYLEGVVKSTNTKFFRFGNNETNTFPCESVREKNVFIFGSGANMTNCTTNSVCSINDNILTMCGMVRSCRDASANKITVICPYFPYCRSDKKDQGRAPIMAKLLADFFKTSGANRLITIDLHASQIQGFFDGPFDNLYAINYLIKRIKEDYPHRDFIVVSPDVGGIKRTENWSKKLGVDFTFLIKSRDHNKISHIDHHKLVDCFDLSNKVVILVDDIGDTLGTLSNASKILKENGAKFVIAVVTHGVFSGKAFENLGKNDIDAMYVTNTLPQDNNITKSEKIKVVDLSELCAKAISCCINAESISTLFDEKSGN